MKKISALLLGLFLITATCVLNANTKEQTQSKPVSVEATHVIADYQLAQLAVCNDSIVLTCISAGANFSPAIHQENVSVTQKSTYGEPPYIRKAPRDGSYYYLMGNARSNQNRTNYNC